MKFLFFEYLFPPTMHAFHAPHFPQTVVSYFGYANIPCFCYYTHVNVTTDVKCVMIAFSFRHNILLSLEFFHLLGLLSVSLPAPQTPTQLCQSPLMCSHSSGVL